MCVIGRVAGWHLHTSSLRWRRQHSLAADRGSARAATATPASHSMKCVGMPSVRLAVCVSDCVSVIVRQRMPYAEVRQRIKVELLCSKTRRIFSCDASTQLSPCFPPSTLAHLLRAAQIPSMHPTSFCRVRDESSAALQTGEAEQTARQSHSNDIVIT